MTTRRATVVRRSAIASSRRLVAGAVLVGAMAIAAPVTGQRTVAEHRITSMDLPSAAIDVDPRMTYVGTRTFDLYGVADVEIHLFVEAEDRRVRRLLWVQFEGYKDDNTHTYDYSSDPTIDVGGLPIHVNARFYPSAGFGGRPGSDGDQVARLLREHGFELGDDLARVRLVWLLNEPARDELMLIYVEDLVDHGLTVQKLGGDPDLWGRFSEELLERGTSAFRIAPETDG